MLQHAAADVVDRFAEPARVMMISASVRSATASLSTGVGRDRDRARPRDREIDVIEADAHGADRAQAGRELERRARRRSTCEFDEQPVGVAQRVGELGGRRGREVDDGEVPVGEPLEVR